MGARMKAYAAQLHLHGSCSEGSGSCLAHDHEAAETGHVDLIWWTDHDFRVANFAKVPGYAFNALQEYATIPNRRGHPSAPTMQTPMTWTRVDATGAVVAPARGAAQDPEAAPLPPAWEESDEVRISGDVVRTGTGSLQLTLPAGGEREAGTQERLYDFVAAVQYHRFPLLSRPIVKLAIYPARGVGTGGEILVRFVFSEQPPDLKQPSLTYAIGGAERAACVEGMEATVPLAWRAGEWNEYSFDPAADVGRLGLPGGLDNSLHRTQIGLRRAGASDEPVVAHFDDLEIAPQVKGTAVLDLHRELLATLPTRVKHLVGIEVSYYGQHINAFGSRVPIPDYQGLLPKALSASEVVEHIHRYGGLACLNHPSRANVDAAAAHLAEQRLFGCELMEVAHGMQGLEERLRLWDRLAQAGMIVTGLGVSDAHTAKQGWRQAPGNPVRWVTRIWAESLAEADLLDALRRGHAFFADPAAFRGDLDMCGPNGARMGDVLVLRAGEAPTLVVRCTGLQAGDLVAWLCNGRLVHAATATKDTLEDEWLPAAPVEGLQAIRVQVHRSRLVNGPWAGIVACGNPVYLTRGVPETSRRVIEC